MDDEEPPRKFLRDRRQHRVRERPLTQQELNTLLVDRTPSEVLHRITREDGTLDSMLKNDNLNLRTLVKVLWKSVNGTEGSQRHAVYCVVQKFVENIQFLHKLDGVLCASTDTETLKDVLSMMRISLEKTPKTAVRAFMMTHKKLVTRLRNEEDLELRARIYKITELFQASERAQLEEFENNQRNYQARQQPDIEVEPGQFRGLSIIPTEQDFDAQTDLVCRANKTHGRYDNVNDYLDIQFRLLRADLILPLRKSILEYQAQGGDEHKHNYQAIKVYSNVRIVRPVCHDKGLCFRLSFDATALRHVNWAMSSRLKYGSLLCLSLDKFQTYRCAVVENREPKDLGKGLVDVLFIFQNDGPNLQMGRHEEFMTLIEEGRDLRYTMVESPTYFEAYKYILLGLQNITEENFPFWRYIGQYYPNMAIDPPQYLLDKGPNVTMDLRPLIDKDYKIKDVSNEDFTFSEEASVAAAVEIQNRESWPNRNSFNLDVSQFSALQSALTKQFVLIQGPPGTGKTFIGLMLMKALLHNKSLWIEEGEEQRPILLVCYTNHALDQFLEGILDFFDGKLVRVGSRSKSEKLEEFSLRSMRYRARENRTVPMEIHLGKMEIRTKMKEHKAEIHLEAAKLDILEREIVSAQFLESFMLPAHFSSLKKSDKERNIADWLGITADIRRIEREMRLRNNQQPSGGVGQAQAAEVNQEGNEVEDEEEEAEEDDIDLFEDVNYHAQRNHLDVEEDDHMDEDAEDLFNELLGIDHLDNIRYQFENVRRVNTRLDEVDVAIEKMRQQNIAFNVCEYGEEKAPSKLSKEEKKYWKNLIPLKKGYRLRLLDNLQKTEKMEEHDIDHVDNIWKMKKNDKWKLYRYWVDLHCRQIRGGIRDKSQEYERLARRYQEILFQEDKVILQKSTIIGMTTTGAARYQEVLRDIGPKIVIVEEAAEVLEGHVITSLSAQSQHVILIGDHKQLRPNPSVHELKIKFNLDISLFERLVDNKFPFYALKYQHRMRPEISQLLRIPDLYPDLEDHESVTLYPHVRNVSGDVRFIHHEMPEEMEGDLKTFSNPFEAMFALGLFEYLIQQGYRSEQITILSPYAGQIHFIKQKMEEMAEGSRVMKLKMKGVKVVSVDNYQGEENDIIILSLVRSNEEDAIGFLKTNNRLCVALSRAKIGLYVTGNLYGLGRSSPLFQKILVCAVNSQFVDDHLQLKCSQHPREITKISMPGDFRNVPEGGCKLPCDIRLDCGHTCPRICHTDDETHREAVCRQNCSAMCEVCEKHCQGSHKCGEHSQCENMKRKVLPNCGHEQNVPCHMDVNQFECLDKCRERLVPCGHMCGRRCGNRHRHTSDVCKVVVQIESEGCEHTFSTECRLSQGDTSHACTQPCGTVLACEHVCPGNCGQCSNRRLHMNCCEPCRKLLICGHQCEAECSNCPPCKRHCENACFHSKCPKLCGELCAPCIEECQWQCSHENKCQERCCQPCERDVCDVPCPKRIACDHICCGLCGEKCPKLCTICNREELLELNEILSGYDGDPTTLFIELDCGHVIDVDFMDQWMKTSTSTEEETGLQAIGLKTCPTCKTPVRKCARYNKYIKEMLCLIESVKRKYIGENKTVEEMKRRRDAIITRIQGIDRQKVDDFIIEETTRNAILSVTLLEAQTNQILLFEQLCALSRVAVECENRWPNRGSSFRKIQSEIDHFQDWSLKKRTLYSDQNNADARLEHGRLSILLDLHKLNMNIEPQGLQDKIPSHLMTHLMQQIKAMSAQGPVKEELIKEGRELCEELKQLIPTSHIALSSEEKLSIVKAMNLQKGAWYKCPKGHIYAIGECGQAAEVSKCPDCKATIGGLNHALDQSNAWAPEMDDAEVPIWENLNADRALAERLEREQNIGEFL